MNLLLATNYCDDVKLDTKKILASISKELEKNWTQKDKILVVVALPSDLLQKIKNFKIYNIQNKLMVSENIKKIKIKTLNFLYPIVFVF